MNAAEVVKTFSDTMSGARDDRPGLADLMNRSGKATPWWSWKLDRLGRTTLHMFETVTELMDRGVTLGVGD